MKCIVKILTASAVNDTNFSITYNASISQTGQPVREFQSDATIGVSASSAQMATNIKNAVVAAAAGQGITVVTADVIVIDTL